MRRRNPHHQPHNRPPNQHLSPQRPKRTPAPIHTIPNTHPLHLLTTHKLNIRTLYRVNVPILRNSISTREFFLIRNNTLRPLHIPRLTNTSRNLNITRLSYIFRLLYLYLSTGHTRTTRKLFPQRRNTTGAFINIPSPRINNIRFQTVSQRRHSPAFTTNITRLKYDKNLINNKLYKTTFKNYFCV